MDKGYIDPRQLLDLSFGTQSHWLQPWRAYLETIPVGAFLDGIGIGFNAPEDAAPNAEESLASHLAAHGVKHARIEVGWGHLNWDETLSGNALKVLERRLKALQKARIRPLILLNAHNGAPCPHRFFSKKLAAPARKGDRSLLLTDVSDLVIGRSGPRNLSGYWAAEALVTAIRGNRVTLSKPLPKDLGNAESIVPFATLKFRPFTPPEDPDYAETMAGWRRYMSVVGRAAREILGVPGAFDIELWNELSFGLEFLYINRYYDPPFARYQQDAVFAEIVKASAAQADAEPGIFQGVRLCNGFANTIPWPASSVQPPRISALSKHPYTNRKNYPEDDQKLKPLNALGKPITRRGFTPHYSALFPEYFATALQTETLIRDAAPLTTEIYGVRHGRFERPGNPCPLWITEVNLSPAENGIKERRAALELKAKTTLRYLCFFLGKGVERLYLYTAVEPDTGLGLITESAVSTARSGRAIEKAPGSPSLAAIQRLVRALSTGSDLALTKTRRLWVDSVTDSHDRFVFDGDGTEEHPPLYLRDVFVALPLQLASRRFALIYYVMTRDILRPLRPTTFTLTLSGLSQPTRGRIYDPLNDVHGETLIDHVGGKLRVNVAATDSPQLLFLDES